MSTQSTDSVRQARRSARRRWLWAHSGRIAGFVIALWAVAFLSFLSAVGYTPALGFLVVIVVGLVLIILGGRIAGR